MNGQKRISKDDAMGKVFEKKNKLCCSDEDDLFDVSSPTTLDDDGSSTVDERSSMTPGLPCEEHINLNGPNGNVAGVFGDLIATSGNGPAMGYHSMQPYLTAVTHTPMPHEFVDYAGMNMNFFSNQMTPYVPFASTSHYALTRSTPVDTFCCQIQPINPANISLYDQTLKVDISGDSGALSELSGESSPESSSSSTFSKPVVNYGGNRFVNGFSVRYVPSGNEFCCPSVVQQSDAFCTVPGRTSLLSSATRYYVTIGEIQRRISPPECLNASLLGGILRKAKSKDGGKTLRESLKRVGLALPAGRRKAATVTTWTALVEEEALHMAKDFSSMCEKDFPVKSVAEYACKKNILQDDLERRIIMIQHTKMVLKELADIVNSDRSPICGSQPSIILAQAMQQRLTHFSLLTHGFGNLAFIAVFDTLNGVLDEMQRYCVTQQQQNQQMNTSNAQNMNARISGSHDLPSIVPSVMAHILPNVVPPQIYNNGVLK